METKHKLNNYLTDSVLTYTYTYVYIYKIILKRPYALNFCNSSLGTREHLYLFLKIFT